MLNNDNKCSVNDGSNAILPKTKYPNKRNRILVTSEELLYALSDAGLLHFLRSVSRDRNDPSKRIWYFDRHDDVKDIISQFMAKKRTTAVK